MREKEAVLEKRPIQDISPLGNTRPLVLDDINKPGAGGIRKNTAELVDTVVITIQSDDRISPATESQDPQNNQYLERVSRLQSFWDMSLGISDSRIKNYNPVLERVRFEMLETEEEKIRFRQNYAFIQIEKALRERFNVAISSVIYDFNVDGKIVSRDMPGQTFGQVLDIGIEYYGEQNPQDVPRMKKEKEGFLKIQDEFYKQYKDKSKKPDKKADIISGPGIVEGTIFVDNFLDRYELLEDPMTKLRYVQMTRFTTDTTYPEYNKTLLEKIPGYIENKDPDIPTDGYFLANPLFNSENLLIERASSLNEFDFQEIVKDGVHRMRHLAEIICADDFRPKDIVEVLNTVLNGADYAWAKMMKLKDKIIDSVAQAVDKISSWVVPVFTTIREEVDWFKKIAVRLVAAGCGLSGGFSIGGNSFSIGGMARSVISFMSGAISAVSRFISPDSKGSRTFPCPSCGFTNIRPYEDYVPSCQNPGTCSNRQAVRC